MKVIKLFVLIILIISCKENIKTSQDLANTSNSITWANLNGIEVGKNGDLFKSDNVGVGWNAGAFSENYLDTLETGLLTTVIKNTNSNRIIGLSSVDKDLSYKSIEYGIYANELGKLDIIEFGGRILNVSDYGIKDTLKIFKNLKEIIFKKNNELIHNTKIRSNNRLYIDIAMNSPSASVSNLQLITD